MRDAVVETVAVGSDVVNGQLSPKVWKETDEKMEIAFPLQFWEEERKAKKIRTKDLRSSTTTVDQIWAWKEYNEPTHQIIARYQNHSF